jgi:hypothetical protein
VYWARADQLLEVMGEHVFRIYFMPWLNPMRHEQFSVFFPLLHILLLIFGALLGLAFHVHHSIANAPLLAMHATLCFYSQVIS